jgi:hypothetical protein
MKNGTVDLKGQWANYAFHAGLASQQNSPGSVTDSNEMRVNPANCPENIELGFQYYVCGCFLNNDTMVTANLSNVLLEPNYEWSEIKIDYPNKVYQGKSYYNLTLSPEVVPLLGDYNDSGTVDAADYTVWKDNLGGDTSVLHGNGVTTTTAVSAAVSAADYALWKNHFGESDASGSSESIPEPTTAVLVLMICVGCFRSHL